MRCAEVKQCYCRNCSLTIFTWIWVARDQLCLPHYVVLISNCLPFVLLFLYAKDFWCFVWRCTMPCPVINPIHQILNILKRRLGSNIGYTTFSVKVRGLLYCTAHCTVLPRALCTEELNHLQTSKILNDSVLALVVFRAVAKSQSEFAAVRTTLCIYLLFLMKLWNTKNF